MLVRLAVELCYVDLVFCSSYNFFEMFTNEVSYLYPPKVASALLDVVYKSKSIKNKKKKPVEALNDENRTKDLSTDNPPSEDDEKYGQFVLSENFYR